MRTASLPDSGDQPRRSRWAMPSPRLSVNCRDYPDLPRRRPRSRLADRGAGCSLTCMTRGNLVEAGRSRWRSRYAGRHPRALRGPGQGQGADRRQRGRHRLHHRGLQQRLHPGRPAGLAPGHQGGVRQERSGRGKHLPRQPAGDQVRQPVRREADAAPHRRLRRPARQLRRSTGRSPRWTTRPSRRRAAAELPVAASGPSSRPGATTLGSEITIEGANPTTLPDNWLIMRYKADLPGLRQPVPWSAFAGDPSAKPSEVRAQLAEGWIKRVTNALNPFDARVDDFVERAGEHQRGHDPPGRPALRRPGRHEQRPGQPEQHGADRGVPDRAGPRARTCPSTPASTTRAPTPRCSTSPRASPTSTCCSATTPTWMRWTRRSGWAPPASWASGRRPLRLHEPVPVRQLRADRRGAGAAARPRSRRWAGWRPPRPTTA